MALRFIPEPIADPPGWLTLVAFIVTQLGDMWWVLGLLAVLYWTGVGSTRPLGRHRRAVVYLFGLVLATFATVVVLKTVIGAPRPPGAADGVVPNVAPPALEPVWAVATEVGGYALPSGHATLTTAAYGGMARRLDAFEPRVRWAVAGLIVVVVSWSRLALGVHFIGDVIVGTALGVGLLFVYELVIDGRPLAGLGGAIVAAIVAAVVSMDPDAALILGLSLGIAAGWAVGTHRDRHVPAVVVGIALLVVAGLGIGGYIVAHRPPVAMAFGGSAGFLMLVLPMVATKLQTRGGNEPS